jgi:inorganic phosphate transporter, PiT family
VEAGLALFGAIVALGWVYAFYTGANDSANSIAASVSCRALRPHHAVLLASALTFTGAFFGSEVARTIGRGIIGPEFMTTTIALSAIVGAIAWTALATHAGLPVSMTHSIVGGILGAGVAAHGTTAIHWSGLRAIVIAMVVSPVAGFVGAFGIIVILLRVFQHWRPGTANRVFLRSQIFSTAFLSFSFGMNNTQNSVGIIAAALLAGGITETFTLPFWVTISCALSIGLGIYLGGQKVIRTTGMRLSKIKPVHGFTADATSASVIFLASLLGIPISTTHVAVTGIMGAATSRGRTAVRWTVVKDIVAAWILTIPAAAGVAATVHYAVTALGGTKGLFGS